MTKLSDIARDLWAGEGARVKWRIAADVLRRNLGPYVLRGHVLYRCDRERFRANPWQPKIEANFRSFETPDLVPDILWKRLNEDCAVPPIAQAFSRGAVLWAAFIGDQPAAFLLSIKASRLGKWYIPLLPNDVVLYGAGTFHEWRGKGLHTDIMRHAIGAASGDIYCDAHKWNATAQRNFEKSGFVRIGNTPELT